MVKNNQLFNVTSFVKSIDSAVALGKTHSDLMAMDSAGRGLLLPRQLEHVLSTITQQRYINLTFLDQGIGVDNSGGAADFITKLKTGIMGDFADVGDNSKGTGKISLTGASDTIEVYRKQASSAWSKDQLEQASLAGRNLPAELIGAHNRKYQEYIDQCGYIGDTAKGKEGLFNYSGWVTEAASNTFDNLTSLQMYKEMEDIINLQKSNVSNDVEFSASKVTVDAVTYNRLSTPYNSNGGAGIMSVREALETNLNVTFTMTPRAVINGVRFVAVYTTSPNGMMFRIPQPLEVSPVWVQGFDSNIQSKFGVGGLDVLENDACVILTGV